MNGHVFQSFNECDDKNQFTKTVEALANYIATHFKYSSDVLPLTRELAMPTIEPPEELPATEMSNLKKSIWEKKVSAYVIRSDYLEDNLKKAYTVAWGQCSDAMRAKLKAHPEFESKHSTCDCVWLLKEIKGIMMRFEGQRYIFLSLDDAHTTYQTFKQGENMDVSTYLKEFQNIVDILEHYGGAVGYDPGLIEAVGGSGSVATKAKKARGKALALAFLKRADRTRYGSLWTDLENQYTRGNDQYPDDLTEAYNMLVSYKADAKPARQNNNNRRGNGGSGPAPTAAPTDVAGMTFAQAGLIAGSDGITHE